MENIISKKSSTFLLLPVLLAGILEASFMARGEFLGFSADGKLAAFGQYWVQDGSGFPEAHLQVLNVADGTVLRSFDSIMENEIEYIPPWECSASANPAWREVIEAAEPLLDSLEITGTRKGMHCLCRLPSDLEVDRHHAVFATVMFSPDYPGPVYELTLSPEPVPLDTYPEWIHMFPPPVLLRAVVRDEAEEVVFNHWETEPVEGFQYVSDYRLGDVFIYGDSAMVMILGTVEPGFEGNDSRYRTLTGLIRRHGF